MMCDSSNALKGEGDKILTNYKRQLAEKKARETAENTDLFSRPASNLNSKRTAKSKLGLTMSTMKSGKSR